MRRNRSRFSSTLRSRYGLLLARLGQRAARSPHLVRRLVVDIGLAGADQVLGPIVELLEIVRRVIKVLAPVKAEPAHVALDRVDIFLLLLGRIGVVKAQVAAAAEFLRDSEIEADRLGMADMQIAVRLRREAGDDAAMAPGCEVGRTMSRMKSRPASTAVASVTAIWSSLGILAPGLCRARAYVAN